MTLAEDIARLSGRVNSIADSIAKGYELTTANRIEQISHSLLQLSIKVALLESTKSESLKALRQKLDNAHSEVYFVWNSFGDKLPPMALNHLEAAMNILAKLIAQEQEKPNTQNHPHSTTVTPRTDPEL